MVVKYTNKYVFIKTKLVTKIQQVHKLSFVRINIHNVMNMNAVVG